MQHLIHLSPDDPASLLLCSCSWTGIHLYQQREKKMRRRIPPALILLASSSFSHDVFLQDEQHSICAVELVVIHLPCRLALVALLTRFVCKKDTERRTGQWNISLPDEWRVSERDQEYLRWVYNYEEAKTCGGSDGWMLETAGGRESAWERRNKDKMTLFVKRQSLLPWYSYRRQCSSHQLFVRERCC